MDYFSTLVCWVSLEVLEDPIFLALLLASLLLHLIPHILILLSDLFMISFH
jgi:hypothetical protein